MGKKTNPNMVKDLDLIRLGIEDVVAGKISMSKLGHSLGWKGYGSFNAFVRDKFDILAVDPASKQPILGNSAKTQWMWVHDLNVLRSQHGLSRVQIERKGQGAWRIYDDTGDLVVSEAYKRKMGKGKPSRTPATATATPPTPVLPAITAQPNSGDPVEQALFLVEQASQRIAQLQQTNDELTKKVDQAKAHSTEEWNRLVVRNQTLERQNRELSDFQVRALQRQERDSAEIARLQQVERDFVKMKQTDLNRQLYISNGVLQKQLNGANENAIAGRADDKRQR